jgi:hypothetical protein
MGAPLTYDYVEKLFASRRKNTDVKKFKQDTHIFKQDDGTFMFKFVERCWQRDKDGKAGYEFKAYHDLLSITPDNVVTLLMRGDGFWPSMQHITLRNRMAQLTGFVIYSDTGHHKNKGTAIRIEGRRYDYTHGWTAQDWCAGGKSLPYAVGTQFKTLSNGRNGGFVECLNPPKDYKNLVKQEAVQQVKADTAIIRKLAMVMARIDFDAEIQARANSSWVQRKPTKALHEVDYKNPTGEDAMAVLYAGLYMTQRPDKSYYDHVQKKWVDRPMDEVIQALRTRIVENGMKTLRKHIYNTTDGYELTEVS